jgi:hypothetical protein
MKKKAYLTPQAEIVEIDIQQQLLAGSPTEVFDEYAGEDIPGLAPDMDDEFEHSIISCMMA